MSKEEYLIITSDKARKNPGAWKTFEVDAEIEVVHAKNRLWTYQSCDDPDKEHLIYEGLKIKVEAGKKLRINAPKDDSGIVIKFYAERKKDDSLSKLKGLNINIMYPSGNTTPLVRTTPIDTKIRLLRVNNWRMLISDEEKILKEGDTLWVDANKPLQFIEPQCSCNGMEPMLCAFVYDIVDFRANLGDRTPTAPEDMWSVNTNYSEIMKFCHVKGWNFQFFGEESFTLQDGMELEVKKNQRYRLMKKDPNNYVDNCSAMIKYTNRVVE